MKKPTRGRPPVPHPRRAVSVHLSEPERSQLEAAAAKAARNLSDWMRVTLLSAAK